MKNCPFFECLSYSTARCDKHIACTGCRIHSDCEQCARQETIVEGVKVRCEHMPDAADSASRANQGS